MEASTSEFWRKCSSCKKPIAYSAKHFICSVSTCNGQRTGYVFCSVPCFERHLPGARHKDAAAIEAIAPRQEVKRTIVREASAAPAAATRTSSTNAPNEVLIIASRLKEYIQARAEMNTSGGVMDTLSDFVRIACDRAIENARADGRKTVMERDFQFLKG